MTLRQKAQKRRLAIEAITEQDDKKLVCIRGPLHGQKRKYFGQTLKWTDPKTKVVHLYERVVIHKHEPPGMSEFIFFAYDGLELMKRVDA